MSVSARSLLVPGMALATAGVVALGPTFAAPPALIPAQPSVQVPTVHVDDIALAGIGRDIYDSITAFVQYTVSSAQYWVGLIPVIGPSLANQLGINYFTGIQPLVESTVYALSDIIANPFNTFAVLANYGANLSYTAYNWVSLQAQFFGLPGLPPIPAPPPLAAVKAPVRGAATPGPAAAVEAAAEASAVEAAPVKAGAVRAARTAQAADSDAPRAAATVAKVAKAAAASDDDGGAASGGETRSAGKAGASRGGAAGR